MVLSITFIRLKSIRHWPAFLTHARRAKKQAYRDDNCLEIRTSGFWKNHYTMTLWVDLNEMHRYVKSYPHYKASRYGKLYAKEIRVIHLESYQLLSWKKAKKLVRQGRNVLSKPS